MAIKRPMRRISRERPGFERPRSGGGLPAWGWAAIAATAALVVIIALVLLLSPAKPPAVQVTPVATTPTHVTPMRPTDTPVPPPATPIVFTGVCTTTQETLLYREPKDNSISQNLGMSHPVNLIDKVEADGRAWYRVTLPGYTEIMYVRADMVECTSSKSNPK